MLSFFSCMSLFVSLESKSLYRMCEHASTLKSTDAHLYVGPGDRIKSNIMIEITVRDTDHDLLQLPTGGKTLKTGGWALTSGPKIFTVNDAKQKKRIKPSHFRSWKQKIFWNSLINNLNVLLFIKLLSINFSADNQWSIPALTIRQVYAKSHIKIIQMMFNECNEPCPTLSKSSNV